MIVSSIFYLAVVIFIVGTGRKILQYAATPAPLKIPTTPAPVTRSGVVWRMTKEVVFFESLFKASKFTWIFGWLFHAGLFIELLWHLRYFTDPPWRWVVWLAPVSRYAGYAMVIGLAGLLARRVFVDRVRAISAPSDYLMLFLILLLAGSGLLIRIVSPTDLGVVHEFTLGLRNFDFINFPGSVVLLFHIVMVVFLLFIFPFSKLLHAPGLFFSPSRNQVDNSREKRHLTRHTVQPDDDRDK